MKLNQRNKRMRTGNANRKNFPEPPPASELIYRGVIPRNTAETGLVAVLRDVASYSTGAGTSFVSYLDNNPSSADNWSEYSTSWSEYRVLGIRLQYSPTYAVNTATVVTNVLVHSVLHMKSTPAIASYSQGLSYGDSKLGHVTKKFVDEWRMNSAEEGTFIDTAAPSGTAFVHTAYADTLSVGVTYGTLFRTWLIQFRNARK